nr:aspartate aminotransferase, cytoplasmic [Ipomoea batatas]
MEISVPCSVFCVRTRTGANEEAGTIHPPPVLTATPPSPEGREKAATVHPSPGEKESSSSSAQAPSPAPSAQAAATGHQKTSATADALTEKRTRRRRLKKERDQPISSASRCSADAAPLPGTPSRTPPPNVRCRSLVHPWTVKRRSRAQSAPRRHQPSPSRDASSHIWAPASMSTRALNGGEGVWQSQFKLSEVAGAPPTAKPTRIEPCKQAICENAKEGKPLVLNVVRWAEEIMLPYRSRVKEYPPITGLADFNKLSAKLIFGANREAIVVTSNHAPSSRCLTRGEWRRGRKLD